MKMGDRTQKILDHVCDSSTDELGLMIGKFLKSSPSDKQRILKELAQVKDSPAEVEGVLLLFTNTFLMTPTKHPLKKTCVRVMNTLDPTLVRNTMASQILVHIQFLELNRTSTSDNTVDMGTEMFEDNFIVILQGLFGNFPAGVEALSQIIDVMFLFAFNMFMKCFKLLDIEEFPLETAQSMLYNSCKFLDTLLHHCDTSIHLPEKSHTLLVASYQAIRHDKITFNTKAHCGALLVIAVVQCPDNLAQEDLNSLSKLLNISTIKPDDNLLTVMLQSCEDCYTTQICIFSGIVHSCPLHVMSKYMVDDTPVAIYIFTKMLDIAMRRSSIAPEILEISRTLVSLSPIISTIEFSLLSDIMKKCWDYIWMHLDHFVDAVRLDAQKLLKTIITILLDLSPPEGGIGVNGVQTPVKPYLQMFTSAISEIIHGRNANFKALAHIASTMKMKVLMEIFPDLPQNLLESLNNSSVAQNVCAAYEKLLEQHFRELPETWMDVWVKPILPLRRPEATLQYVLRIFNAAFKLNADVVYLVGSTFAEAEYRALLGCAITARKSNSKLDDVLKIVTGQQGNGMNIFSHSHLQILICHQSAEIRILVLTLIVECLKSTELFLYDDFKLLIKFFRYNSVAPAPNFRQNMTALYKKALNRFKDSFYVIQRTIRNEEARGADSDADKVKSFKEKEAYYTEFVVQFFHQQLIRGLFTQAEYGKRAMCLELLLHMKTCLPTKLYNDQWFYPDYMHMLFGAFNDTYESNLVMVRKLLVGLPAEIVFRQYDAQGMEERVVDRFDLRTTSATYEILVHMRAPNALEFFRKIFDVKELHEDDVSAPMFVYRQLSAQIDSELETAKIAKNNAYFNAPDLPVHCVLFFLRHLIREEELDIQHAKILPKLVKQSLDIVQLALPVVNSSAPEGYNPNNVDYEKADVTPQLVLLHAWRTIKEVSLLFGELQINHDAVKAVLSKDALLENMAKYFIELFESAKHRGAFEQGYVGFSKLTEKLWNSSGEWAKLPEKWLEDALQLITSTDAKLCATRRSAGIPFMIQGILITEPKHRASQSFHHCMKYLLKVAQNYAVDNQTSAIHSMNILRALFRHNQLGEVVASYVSQGVMIAITQFSHCEWGIRNSATLMFSALMMRMFGVQRLKDCEDISIKNRLPFKVFKTRYPDLYKFLFDQLDQCVARTEENVSLYPILVILGRIYLTFDTPRDDALTDHLNSIIKATTRTIHKIRELAVSATITFETFLNQKPQVAKVTNNQIHGYLLRLKHHVRSPELYAGPKLTLNHFKPLFVLISEAGKGISQTCASLLMDILIDFLKSYDFKDEDLDTYKQLLGYLHTRPLNTISTCARFVQTRFTLYLHVILKIPQAQWYTRTFIASALLQALSSRNEDLNIYALNCIRYISSEVVEEPESRELEYEFVQTLSVPTKGLLNYIIGVHLIKRRAFVDLFDILRNRSRLYGLKVCQVLYNYPSIVYTIRPLAVPVKLSHQIILDYLDRQATCINSEMFVAIMGLISKFVAGSNEPLDLADLIDHMEEFGTNTEHDSTVEERLAVANFLLQNCNLLVNCEMLEEYLRLKLWIIYLEFMQDDEYVVREFCSQISERILNATNSQEVNEYRSCLKTLIPERLHEDVLAYLPYFIEPNNALSIYVNLSLQLEEVFEFTDEHAVYEKQRPPSYRESPFAPQAKHYLAWNLWKLDQNLSYADKTIFLEEHYLLVATKLLNIIMEQDKTVDRSLCVAVLVAFVKYLEGVKVGTATPETILDNFVLAFKAAETEERVRNKQVCSCVIEVSQFLSSVLFTCREREDLNECKCDNL